MTGNATGKTIPCGSDFVVELTPDFRSYTSKTRNGGMAACLPVLRVYGEPSGTDLMHGGTRQGNCPVSHRGTSTCTRAAASIRPVPLHLFRQTPVIHIKESSRRPWGHYGCWRYKGKLRITYWWRPPVTSMQCKVSLADLQFGASGK